MYLSPNNTNKHTVFFQKGSIFYHTEFFLLDFSRLQPSVIKRIDLLSYAKLSQWIQINLWEITECGSHLAWTKKLDKDHALYPCLVLEEATCCRVGIVIISIFEMRHFKRPANLCICHHMLLPSNMHPTVANHINGICYTIMQYFILCTHCKAG